MLGTNKKSILKAIHSARKRWLLPFSGQLGICDW